MAKGFFFSLPSDSVNKSLLPLVDELCDTHQITYFNTSDYRDRIASKALFREYTTYAEGYRTVNIAPHISYFQFADILLRTAAYVIEDICKEIAFEKPDFILHSHLAPWGKLAARYFNIPAVSLFSTFVLDEKIMLPRLKQLRESNKDGSVENIQDAVTLYRKLMKLQQQLSIGEQPDIWDLYVNREAVNISFIHPLLQPQRDLLAQNFHFVGFHMPPFPELASRDTIYISMGTVMNKDVTLFKKIIQVLTQFNHTAIISIGNAIQAADLGPLPPQIQICAYVDQLAILQQCAVFITRGGMASVQEAICTHTPMLVIPDIPEQQITAERISELQIGINAGNNPEPEDIESALREILTNREKYLLALRDINAGIQGNNACKTAASLIDDYLSQPTEQTTNLFIHQN
ncbi:nucleotide disphospho-sugar-binding domain-containing protein [Chitinophaga rhizophila]|uniref:Erythromycin biosynthesis protein CIII-like C-terminal domain-containing protein n=1 Tax=Chitinophaga rhizophila TaxID=2866212 RepID=A0ABS7G6P9_9BACT|nr:nucleotide disphospho-sugar-binding domain-containing protein [Chitinophaga rhizophila]MBW8683056.1 hypothetical protein [Chitinophaga rhizophila]